MAAKERPSPPDPDTPRDAGANTATLGDIPPVESRRTVHRAADLIAETHQRLLSGSPE